MLHLGFCPEVRSILNGKVSHVTPQVGKAAIECERKRKKTRSFYCKLFFVVFHCAPFLT